LPRRGTFVEECRRKGPVILADAGGAASGTSVYDRLKFEAIAKGELAMGIAAHNIGRAEAELGPEYLRRVRQDIELPLISANAADSSGKPLAEPMRIVEAGGRRVAIIGVIDPKYRTSDIRISPPKQAVLESLRKAAGKFDQAIVLAYMPEESLRELAESLPEVDAVVGGPTGQPIQPDSHAGVVLLASATKQGKFMAKLTHAASVDNKNALQGEIVELDGHFADEPRQMENLRAFYDELKRRDLPPGDTSFLEGKPSQFAGNTRNAIAGSDACKACHDEDYRLWKDSKHAVAWKSLVDKDAQYNPDCQRCHVTGYGESGGFATVKSTPERVGVGCESCHGMSRQHCRTTSTKTAWAERAKDRCRDCHDRENSPKFDYDTYWAKIKHGAPAAEPQETESKTSSEESP
jgi:hypothetical protein